MLRWLTRFGLPKWLVGLMSSVPITVGLQRMEEGVVKELSPVGPIVAVGEPGQWLPSAGASRDYYSNEQWQGVVEDWIKRARLIVLIVGKTPAVNWELDTVLRFGNPERLILLFPSDLNQNSRTPERLDDRWQRLKDAFEHTSWCKGISCAQTLAPIALYLGKNGIVNAIVGPRAHAVDYELALRIAAYKVLRSPAA
jgi:hypothetical protein